MEVGSTKRVELVPRVVIAGKVFEELCEKKKKLTLVFYRYVYKINKHISNKYNEIA